MGVSGVGWGGGGGGGGGGVRVGVGSVSALAGLLPGRRVALFPCARTVGDAVVQRGGEQRHGRAVGDADARHPRPTQHVARKDCRAQHVAVHHPAPVEALSSPIAAVTEKYAGQGLRSGAQVREADRAQIRGAGQGRRSGAQPSGCDAVPTRYAFVRARPAHPLCVRARSPRPLVMRSCALAPRARVHAHECAFARST